MKKIPKDCSSRDDNDDDDVDDDDDRNDLPLAFQRIKKQVKQEYIMQSFMQSVVRQRVFYAHTTLCNQFEAALGSWVRTFPTEFVYFCWCYNLGQKKNIYLFGYPTVPAKEYQP